MECPVLFLVVAAILLTSSNVGISSEIRLVGGQDQYEGRVEVYYNGTWGTVCDDRWDDNDATVVCKMLGYSTGATALKCATFGCNTSLLILLDEVECFGNESSIYNCSHDTWYKHNCIHDEDAGVHCDGGLGSNFQPNVCTYGEYGLCFDGCRITCPQSCNKVYSYAEWTNDTCQCWSGYTTSETCKADVGSACDTTGVCSNPFAVCTVGYCQCLSGYTTSGPLCKADVGVTCDTINGCSNPYASCTGGYCRCRSGYTSNGTLCEADLNSSCNTSIGCSDQYAECKATTSGTNTTCQCTNNYSVVGGICKADLNSSCNTSIGCSDQYAECKDTTSGTNTTCQCKNNYSVVGGICKADLNSSCNTSIGCSDQYAECKATTSGTNTTCQCKNNYSVVGGICKADLNSSCNTSIGCSDQYAECKATTSGTNTTCQCKNNYSVVGGICKADLNSSCNTSIGCSDQYAECKATTSGTNTTCQCKNNYSVVGGICKADLNSSCNTSIGCSDQYAECKATTSGTNTTCQCKNNYSVVGGICKADLNSSCNTSIGCSDQYAECKATTSGTNTTCQCKNNYSVVGGICKADLNSSCNTSIGCSDQYAECKATTSGTNTTCQCKNNYSVVGGICKADLNSSCNTSIGCSDQYAECKATTSGTNTTCQCKNNYSVVGGICKADLNSSCNTSIGCSDQYAECKATTSGTNTTCQCKNNYSVVGGICKADLNSSCNTSIGCSDQYAECKATTSGTNTTCQCKNNYSVVGGICKADLNSSCNTSIGCSDQYAECKATTSGTNTTCQCKNNYSVVGGICKADLNSSCNTSIGCSDQYAECKATTSGTNTTCQCKNNYSVVGGICKADLNSSCNTSIGCSDQYAECKATTSGTNTTCQCKNNYSVVGGICKADLNSSCNTSIGCSDQYAECKATTSGTNTTCQCKNNYSVVGGICKADLNSSCNTSIGCSDQYAECKATTSGTNTTCQCKNNYSVVGGICKADLNSSCNTSIGCSDQYAECKATTSGTNTTCQCKNNYSVVGGICKADLNSSCNTSIGCSDQYAECKATTSGTNTTCQCKNNYSVVGGICKADLNSSCNTSIGCSDQYAECKATTSGTNTTCQCKNNYSVVGGICKADLISSCNTSIGCSEQYAECKATTSGTNTTCQCKNNYSFVGGICKADGYCIMDDINITDAGGMYNGNTVNITCMATTVEITQLNLNITWKYNGNVMRPTKGSRISIYDIIFDSSTQRKMLNILSFRPIRSSDSGTYECIVTDRCLLPLVMKKSVYVLSQPVVSIQPVTQTVDAGYTINITCQVENNVPLTQIVWYRNDAKINATSQLSEETWFTISNRTYILTRKNIDRATVYKCGGENDAGPGETRQANISVIIPGPGSHLNNTCFAHTDTRGTSWSRTLEGAYDIQPCLSGQSGEAVRYCSQGGVWRNASYDNCVNNTFIELQTQTENIKNGLAANTVPDSLVKLTSATNPAYVELKQSEVHVVSSVLDNVVQISARADNITNSEVENFLQIASNVIDEKNSPSWQALIDENKEGASMILRNVEEYCRLRSQLINTTGEYVMRFPKKNLFVEIGYIPVSNIQFPNKSAAGFSFNSNTGYFLSQDALSKGVYTTYSAAYFKNVSGIIQKKILRNGFITSLGDDLDINSEVLSLQLDPRPDSLSPPLTLTFEHFSTNYSNPVCSFWKFNADGAGNGAWSSQGCKLVSTNDYTTVCQCDHLTNFAILMSPGKTLVKDLVPLSIISIIGCTISIFCLLVTIIVHFMVWRYVKSDSANLLMNLCLALIISYVIFLAGVDATENKDACTAVAALLHYFYLAVFFLMLAYGIEIAVSVIYVFDTRSRVRWLMPIAWILPAVVVAISLGVTQLKGYGNDKFCWLSVNDGLIWAFVGPAALVILINFIIIILVLRQMFSSSAMLTKSDKVKAKTAVRSLCILLPITGITWVFGILSVNEDLVVFQYLFAIVNSFQGLFISLFHCFFSRNIRNAIKQSIAARKRSQEPYSATLKSSSQSTGLSGEEPKTDSKYDERQAAESEPKRGMPSSMTSKAKDMTTTKEQSQPERSLIDPSRDYQNSEYDMEYMGPQADHSSADNVAQSVAYDANSRVDEYVGSADVTDGPHAIA